jgi:hypothetical protein
MFGLRALVLRDVSFRIQLFCKSGHPYICSAGNLVILCLSSIKTAVPKTVNYCERARPSLAFY